MAETMLDRLFFAIGWDTSDFDRGRRKVEKDFDDTRESSRKVANDIEASGKRAASFFRSLRNETVGLFLAFSGASSLKSFVADIVDGAASTDRLAKNMGVARNELYGWQNLIKTVGGSAADATSALQVMASQIQASRAGVTTGNEQLLMGLGVTPKNMSSPSDMLLQVADGASRMSRPQAAMRLGMLGFTPEMIDILTRGRREVSALIEEQKRLATYTDEDVEKARAFQEQWAKVSTHLKGVLTPLVTEMIGKFADWLASISSEGWQEFGHTVFVIGDAFKHVALWTEKAFNALNEYNKAGGISGMLGLGNSIGFSRNGGLLGWLMGESAPEAGPASGGGGAPIPSAVANGPVSGLFSVLEKQYGTARARGIWAGIGAESSWNPNAVNPTSGAYGLGQWLGPRKKALFARYGNKPTAAQQIEFLMSELNGGDPGGKSVLQSSSAEAALRAYILNFMRPAKGYETNRDIASGMRTLGVAPRAPVNTGGGGSSTVVISNINMPNVSNAQEFAKDLPVRLREKGVIVQSASGMSQ